MVPYCDAYETAHKLDAVLKRAVELRAGGKQDEARGEVSQHGVPLWLAMAPRVREVMLQYQAVIATRPNQGQLASMQNKFVRISLERLRLSIKEFLGKLPLEMEQAYATATSPESANPARRLSPLARRFQTRRIPADLYCCSGLWGNGGGETAHSPPR